MALLRTLTDQWLSPGPQPVAAARTYDTERPRGKAKRWTDSDIDAMLYDLEAGSDFVNEEKARALLDRYAPSTLVAMQDAIAKGLQG